MNKKRELILIILSIAVSISMHIGAILFINNMKIKTLSVSKNIDFIEEKAEKKHMPFSKISKLVLKNNIKNQKLKGITYIKLPPAISADDILIEIKNVNSKTEFFTFKPEKQVENFELISSSKCVPYFEFYENNLASIVDEIKKPFDTIEKTQSDKKIVNLNLEENIDFNNNFSKLIVTNAIPIFENTNSEEKFLEKFKSRNQLDVQKILNDESQLISIPKLDELSTISYKDFFDVEVSIDRDENNSAFVFAITIVPKNNIKLPMLKKNIFFLVDKSNSIQQERLDATRHAVMSAIHHLNKEDSFNIITFDSKMDQLSSINLNVNNKSISEANKFLLSQKIGSFFSSTNFSQPLFKILNQNCKNDEVNIAILISNGEGLNKLKKYRSFNQFTNVNNGNFSLYTLGAQEDKNLQILNLFSKLNKGELFVASDHKNIKRKLLKIIKNLESPVVKELKATTICKDNENSLYLFQNNDKIPNLFLNQPYTILGTCKTLEDFTIFLQGTSKDHFINLKKVISLQNAKLNNPTLRKELAIKKASAAYAKYVADNNPIHLEKAKQILKPFEIEPVFK